MPPPREIPFDLIAQATLMFLPLLLGISLAIANLDRLARGFRTDSPEHDDRADRRIAWVCLVVPIGRLAHLWSIWRHRVADAEGRPRPRRSAPRSSARAGGASARSLIDTSLGCVAAVARGDPVLGRRPLATSPRRCGGSWACRSRSPR